MLSALFVLIRQHQISSVAHVWLVNQLLDLPKKQGKSNTPLSRLQQWVADLTVVVVDIGVEEGLSPRTHKVHLWRQFRVLIIEDNSDPENAIAIDAFFSFER